MKNIGVKGKGERSKATYILGGVPVAPGAGSIPYFSKILGIGSRKALLISDAGFPARTTIFNIWEQLLLSVLPIPC